MVDGENPPPNSQDSQYFQYKFKFSKPDFPDPQDVPFSEAALEDIQNGSLIRVPVAEKITLFGNGQPEKNGVEYSSKNKIVYKTSGKVTLEDGKEHPLKMKIIFEKLKLNCGNGKSRYIEIEADIENGKSSKKFIAGFFYIGEEMEIEGRVIDKGLLPCEGFVKEIIGGRSTGGIDMNLNLEDYRTMITNYAKAGLENISISGIETNGLVIPYDKLNGKNMSRYM